MPTTQSQGWRERFDEEFLDELIDRFHEFGYTEGHEKPLAAAKQKVKDIKQFIASVEREALQKAAQVAREHKKTNLCASEIHCSGCNQDRYCNDNIEYVAHTIEALIDESK